MTKKKAPPYTELDIILQANAITMKEIQALAQDLFDKYEGGMTMNVATQAAKDYYLFGQLPMKLDPDLRKQAEREVGKHFKERAERLAKKIAPIKEK